MDYVQLTSLPLFTGISGEDLALILDRVELLDFDLAAGERLVESGTVCQGMTIVREGVMRRTQHFDGGTFVNNRRETTPIAYEVTETLRPGFIIEPEILFGLDLRHQNTWTADSTCRLTMISKQDIRQTLMYVPVWRMNLLNLLSTKLQRSIAQCHPQVSGSHEQLFLQFLQKHCSPNSISLTITSTNEQLANYLGVERRTFAKMLKGLQEKGVLRKEFQRITYNNGQPLP